MDVHITILTERLALGSASQMYLGPEKKLQF